MARTAQPSTDMTSSPTCIHACICVHIVACARVLVLENITSKSDQVLNMTLSPTLTVPLLAAGPSSARPTIRMPACVCSCRCARACVQACMRACMSLMVVVVESGGARGGGSRSNSMFCRYQNTVRWPYYNGETFNFSKLTFNYSFRTIG